MSLGVLLLSAACLAGFDPCRPDAVTAEGAPAAQVALVPGDGGVRVRISSSEPLTFVRLFWRRDFAADTRFFGGDWERTYGKTGWMGRDELRPMPWYFLAEEKGRTSGWGVKVQPGAFAAWVVTNGCVELVLDCRAGSDPVSLGGRTLEACTIVTRTGVPDETPYRAAQAFCRMMCDCPRLPKAPVYGYNDWYCAYGRNTAEGFLADAKAVLALADGLANRPFAVCDDGWQAAEDWRGVNARWGLDMDRVAARLKAADIRPGLWYRPLKHFADDPTRPAVAETVRGDIAAFRRWGYELLKIDFITYDWNHAWNPQGVSPVTRDDLHWRDRTRTTAETVRALYRTFREAAGEDVTIIGCNALDHFAAGLFEVQRTGDDTSGCDWSLTELCGPNALGMRAHHHGTFYAQDGDCAGLSFAGAIDWVRNRQWIDLLSRSGGAFFVSWYRDYLDAAAKTALKEAFARASVPQPAAEPLDWQERTSPVSWRCGETSVRYDWRRSTAATNPVTRFLVIGDLHYYNIDDNGDPAEARAQRLADDVRRKGIDYDFIVQVGDLVNCQTGYTPRCYAECHAEWEGALRDVKRLFPGKPFLLTPGNHDWYGGDSWQGGLPCLKAHYLPFMEKELGQPMNGLPLTSFRVNDCCFIFLNHLGMNPAFDVETRRLLDRTLSAVERDPSVARVFAVSHPQLWNVDYFRFHENATLLPRFLQAKKFDAYFSGHIHINSLTARKNDLGMALRQVTAAGTWPPIDEGEMRFHPVPWLTLNPAPSVKLFEDHPADVQSYTVVTASREKVNVRFEAVGGGNIGEYEWTGPYETKAVRPADRRWKNDLPARVTRARLYYFPYFADRVLGGGEPPRVRLNGTDIGALACNRSFFHTNWGKFFLEVPPELVRSENTVEILNPTGAQFLLRDLSVMAAGLDGVERFTPVYGKVLSFGDAHFFYMGFGLAHPGMGIIHSDVGMNVPDELLECVVPPTDGARIRLAFDARPVLAINEDNDHYFKQDASLMTREALVDYLDAILRPGAVTDFFMCPCGQRASYASDVWEPIWAGSNEPNADGETNDIWCVNAKALNDRGIDPYAVWLARCHEKGVRAWLSMRMNDVHFVSISNYFRNTTFWRTRRDLRRRPDLDPSRDRAPWEDFAFDYVHPEVQDHHFAMFRELVDRYDADGYELDWMRFTRHLTPGRERELSDVLTSFMRRCRAHVDEAARRRGHPILVSARVPTTYAEARSKGFDPETWAREGLIDWLITTNFYDTNDFEIDVADWTRRLAAANPRVRVFPGASDNLKKDGQGRPIPMTAADFSRWSGEMRQRGATGLYLFNVPYLPEDVRTFVYGGMEESKCLKDRE